MYLRLPFAPASPSITPLSRRRKEDQEENDFHRSSDHFTNWKKWKVMTTMGLEPTIFRFEVGRRIRWATRPKEDRMNVNFIIIIIIIAYMFVFLTLVSYERAPLKYSFAWTFCIMIISRFCGLVRKPAKSWASVDWTILKSVDIQCGL